MAKIWPGWAGPAAQAARVRTHVPRGARVESWNRRSRWCAAVDRLPKPPTDHPQHQHIHLTWGFIQARTLRDGWEKFKREPKRDMPYYIAAARIFTSVLSHQHEESCSLCTRTDWLWAWAVVDEADVTMTETTDETPSTTSDGGST
jgi:hypothetical protein